MSSAAEANTAASCVVWILIFILNITVGAACFGYDMNTAFGLDNISIGKCMLGGIFTGGLAIPTAIVFYIMQDAGVQAPFKRLERATD